MNSEASALIVLCVLAGAVLGGLGAYALLLTGRKNLDAEARQRGEELKGQFAALSAEVFQGATDQFLKLAESRLATERVKGGAELEEKRRAVETTVGQLTERLKEYEKLMRGFEADRSEKFGSIEAQLKRSTETAEQLQAATVRLGSVLGNSRTRGQWGERMAEDILRAVGLIENVQYLKNRAQETSATRPDYTFLLPDDHRLHMDVKFPLDNYLRMIDAESPEERERFKGVFLKDVKKRVKEIQDRDYVNPQERTLDCVLLFIPNEHVYGFILQNLPGLIDEALAQKVVLASPFSLYAVLAVVRQSFENFHFSQATREVVELMAKFRSAFELFKERFDRVGKKLEETARAYQEITGPSYKNLDRTALRIEKVGRGDKAKDEDEEEPVEEIGEKS